MSNYGKYKTHNSTIKHSSCSFQMCCVMFLCCGVIFTCLMLLVTNQTMNIREHTCTPVTITEVLTIPAAKKDT